MAKSELLHGLNQTKKNMYEHLVHNSREEMLEEVSILG